MADLLSGEVGHALTGAGEIRDLAFDGVHSYTADGHSGAWLGALDRLVDELAGVPLYPGHGAPGDTGLLIRQRQRTEQERVDQNEDGGVGADADGQRQHDDQRESEVVAERAHGVQRVLAQLGEVVGALHGPLPFGIHSQ